MSPDLFSPRRAIKKPHSLEVAALRSWRLSRNKLISKTTETESGLASLFLQTQHATPMRNSLCDGAQTSIRNWNKSDCGELRASRDSQFSKRRSSLESFARKLFRQKIYPPGPFTLS